MTTKVSFGSTCSGTPKLPTTGPLSFNDGTRRVYARDCDAFGKCSAWRKDVEDEVLHVAIHPPGVGNDTQLWPTGEVTVSQAVVGDTVTQRNGSSTYRCRRSERGTGRLDVSTGKGTGDMQLANRCDVAGGSGGPSDIDDRRPVSMKLGSRCLAVTDDLPATRFGKQKRTVLQFRW